MKKCAIAAMATIPLLAACYPMEQAPLVYASKATVGVGVQAGTSDNPGLEMILGYKASDIALVPVAVAKFCRDRSRGGSCEHAIYSMSIINGRKQDHSSNGSIQLALGNAELEKKRAENHAKVLQGEQQALLARQSLVIERDTALAGLKAERATLAASDQDATVVDRLTALDAASAKLQSQKLPSATDIAEQIRNKEEEIKIASSDVSAAESNIKSLNAKLSNEVSGERGDSLSVYGTFGGTGQASNSSAGLNGDKVFATGIAAQNLSEYRGATDCLGAVHKLAKALPDTAVAERSKLIADASIICVKPQ